MPDVFLLTQLGQMIEQRRPLGEQLAQSLALGVDQLRFGVGDELFVPELGLLAGDLLVQAGELFGRTCVLGFVVADVVNENAQ